MVTLLDQLKSGLLNNLGGKFTLAKFFDFDDGELDDRLGELLENEEWDASEMLELAAVFLIMYLKEEYDNMHGLGAL